MCFKRESEEHFEPFTFHLIHDVEIFNVTAIFFQSENQTCLTEKVNMNIYTNQITNQEYLLFERYSTDCFTPPFVHKISCLINPSVSRFDFKNRTGEVMFHAKVGIRYGVWYLSIFKRGSTSEVDMEVSLYNDNIISTLCYVVSDNITNKIILDKSIDACNILKVIDDLHVPLDNLYANYCIIYNSFFMIKEDLETINSFKSILSKYVKEHFEAIQNLRIEAKVSYDTKLYEEEILHSVSLDGNLTSRLIVYIKNVIDNINKDITERLLPLYEQISKKAPFIQTVGSAEGILRINRIKSNVDLLNRSKKQLLNIIVTNKLYTEYRNEYFRRENSEENEETHTHITALQRLSGLLKLHIKSQLINCWHGISDRNPIFSLDFGEMDSSLEVSLLYSEIRKSLTKDLDDIEKYVRVARNLDMFDRDPCIRTVVYLIKDETFRMIRVDDLEKSCHEEKSKVTKIIEMETEKYKALIAKYNKILPDLNDIEGLISDLKAFNIYELLSMMSKKEETDHCGLSEGTLEKSKL